MATKDIIRMTVPVPPLTNRRLVPGIRKTKRGKSYIGHRRSTESTEYQKHIFELCRFLNIKPFTGNVVMQVYWFRASKRGDIPDRWKDLCDGLETMRKVKGVKGKTDFKHGAYLDDNQIKRFIVERFDTDKLNPRCEVKIWPTTSC